MPTKANPAKQLQNIIAQKAPPQSILLLSPDRIRMTRALNMLIEKLGFQNAQNIKINIADTKEEELKTLGMRSSELSLFASKKLFLISNLEKITASKSEIIIKALSNDSPDNLFLIYGQSLKANTKLYKMHKDKKAIVTLDTFTENELYRWLTKEIQEMNIKTNKQVIDLIVSMSDNSADKAYAILEQLDLYSEDKQLKASDLLSLFPTSVTANEFQWVDLINQKKISLAEASLENLLAEGKNPFALLGLLHRTYVNYFLIASMLTNRHSHSSVKQSLKLQPWLLNKYIQIASKEKPEILKEKLNTIVKTDSLLKNKSLGEANIFSELIYKLAA